MKIDYMKRILAIMLCVVLAFGANISVWAENEELMELAQEQVVQEEVQLTEEKEETKEEVQEVVEEVVKESKSETNTQKVVEEKEEKEEKEEVQEELDEKLVDEELESGKLELQQLVKDNTGKVLAKVIAKVPEGAFEAEDSQVSMKVETVSTGTEKTIIDLMKKNIGQENNLGDYFLYDVRFLVDGIETNPDKIVEIIFREMEFTVLDADTAKVFYYNPAKSDAGNQKEEIVVVPDKANANGSTIVSDIVTKANGLVDQVSLKGNRSRIYGVYTEETKELEVEYEEPVFATTMALLNNVTIKVKDDVINTGTLIAEVNQVITDEKVEFVWYKKINSGAWQKVIRTKSGDQYNLSEDGSTLNIALDQGALSNSQSSVVYKVEIFQEGLVLATSADYNVTYWNELRNGSFEEPVFTERTNQVANGFRDLIWRTTGTNNGRDIEIVHVSDNTRSSVIQAYSFPSSVRNITDDGNQFAELNCEAVGALYQDVMTIGGTELNYWFSHRARGKNADTNPEYDTMYLLMLPTSVAKAGIYGNNNEIDTQAEVQYLMNNIHKFPGAEYKTIVSSDQSWNRVTGTYTPTSYLTRFFFVAGTTASGSTTVGNFLDRVGFGQSLPPANNGKFNFQIKKTIEGINLTEFEELKSKLTFKITASSPSAPLHNQEIKASQMSWTVSEREDGTISAIGTYVFQNQSIGGNASYVYKVTEAGKNVDGYTLSEKVVVVGGEVQADQISTKLKEQDTATFEFTNTYKWNTDGEDLPDTTYIRVQKSFVGLKDLNDIPKDFQIRVYSDQNFTTLVANLKLADNSDNVELIKSQDGYTYTWIIKGLNSGTYYLKEVNEDVDGYTSQTIINGEEKKEGSVSVKKPELELNGVINRVTSCKNTNILTGNFNFIAMALTSGGVFVIWTEEYISQGEREALVGLIHENVDGPFGKIKVSDCVFFSGDAMQKGINYRGEVKVVTENGNTSLTFSASKQWSQVCYGDYNKVGKVDAEIDVVNSYTEDAVKIDLKKYGTSYDNQIDGASFTLFKGIKNDNEVIWEQTPYGENYTDFQINKTLELLAGYYKLEEIKAPSGYAKLTEPIYFKIENKIVSLIDVNGNSIGNEQEMWKLVKATSQQKDCIQILNKTGYLLPDTGGVGTFWYFISGILLMLVATLILYKNKLWNKEQKN